MSTTPPVTWDLSDLYQGADDAKIVRDLAALELRAGEFAGRYRGRIADLTPAEFATALTEYEAMLHDDQFPGAYAHLLFASDTQTPAHGALLQQVQERDVAISRQLLFFTLELIQIPDAQFAQWLEHPVVHEYRHYLEHQRALRPHRLSEAEERILLEKSTTGRDAFSRLFDEIINGATFTLELAGERREMSESELLSHLYAPVREERRAAADGLTAGLRERSRLFTFITNTLVYDKTVDDRLAHFATSEAARHLS